MLKNTQIKVFEASCGEECIQMLKEHKYHMVFWDHMMPNMDGIETFEIIKKEKLCEGTPVIMFTANAMTGEKEKYLHIGFHDFLAKPFVLEQLHEIILNYLPKELIQECEINPAKEEVFDPSRLPVLEEFDFGYAMGMLKSEELLLQSLENFRDILKYVPEKLNRFLEDIGAEDGLSMYRIEVHALKSTSATVGALLLSKLARIIEVAAIDGEIQKIMLLHPVLLEEIKKYQYPGAAQKLVDELTGQVLNLKPAGYILKPVEKERILQTLKEVLGE